MKKAFKRILIFALVLAMMPWGSMSTAVNAANEKGDFTDQMVDTEKDLRAYSNLTTLLTDGYIAEVVTGNIENWQLNALIDNPGIIEKIWDHSVGANVELSSLYNDGWNMTGTGLIGLSIKQNHTDFGNAVQWTNKAAGTIYDIDLAFGRQAGSICDWRDAKYLWFYVDVSIYGNSEVPLGIGFEEYDAVGSDVGTDRESWSLKNGSTVRLYPTRGDAMDVQIQPSTQSPLADNGRIYLPADFVGWVRIPVTESNFFKYWEYPSANGTLDKMDIHQFIICIESTADSVNGSAYLGPFMLSGDTDQAPTKTTKDQYTSIWDLNHIKDSKQNDDLAWMVEAAWAWYNEYPGKLLTGVAYSYRLSPSDELKAAGDMLVSELKRVQKDDGYLGIFDGNQRYGGGGANWDVWGHYHIIYGLYQWYLATGNQDAMSVACKAADGIIAHFETKSKSYVAAGTAQTNMAISHAFAVLYRETGEQKYLDEAIKIVDTCWQDPLAGNWLESALAGKEFYEMVSNKNPYTNRWEALHPLMTLSVLYEVTGDERYYTALENLWLSIQKTDRHNSGSFSVGEGACGDPFKIGGIETCCSVAWLGLTTEYLQVSRNSIAADELELGYFNTIMACVLEGHKYVTYDTQMNGSLIPATQQLAFQSRANSPEFSCCQANAARAVGELSQWALLTDNTGLYWNYYGKADLTTTTPSGQKISAVQESVYPENGNIKITITELAESEKFTIWFRVPSWASAYKVIIGDQAFYTENTGAYLPITGTWSEGNVIEIEIGMTFHFWQGANECDGYTSIYYGPILLAADSNYTNLLGTINIASLKDATITTSNDMLLSVEIPVEGSDPIKLISFADVGSKGSAYRSWLRTKGDIQQNEYVKNGTPVWCSNLIPVGNAITPDAPNAITPDAPNAITPDAPNAGTSTNNDADKPKIGWVLPCILGGAAICAGAGIFCWKFCMKKKEQ